MNRFLLFITLIFYSSLSYGQTPLFEEGFENSVTGWTPYEDQTPNYWLANTCAGNGGSQPGQVSMYITYGGPNIGCGGGGAIHYGYVNSDNGVKSAVIAHLIEATCASDLHVSFDYNLAVGTGDAGELIYSTDNGVTWTVISTLTSSASGWQTITNTPLPASLDFSNFLLGWRFTYDETIIGFNPLAIDNILVSGTDTEDPVATCPPNQVAYANAGCAGELGDYTSLVTAVDNCASGSDFTYTQTPAPGTMISTNTAVQITVFDVELNSGSCSFTVQIIDTIDPVIVCVESMTIAVNSACEFLVPDLTSTVNVTDNCTTGMSNFTITQNPLAGSTASGVTSVFISVTDQGGNTSICETRIDPQDTQAPVVTCPANATISNGTNCSYVLTDYASAITVVESCPFPVITQNPPAGATIPAGQNAVVFTVADQMGNEGTCTFYVTVIETIPPVITLCPASVATCNPLVTFDAVTATDNCSSVLITQTDGSGLESGDIFPVGVTAMQFTARDSSGNTAVCNFNIEVYEFPADAVITSDSAELCNVMTATLNATPVTSGTGSWSQISGSSTIANPSSASTAVSSLSPGTNTFVWTVTSAHCGTKKDTTAISVYLPPSVASIQNDTIYACSALSSLLSGSFPTVGTATWTTQQGANIINPNQHNTLANGLAGGWNDFIYTISNGNCPSSADTLSIYFNNQGYIVTSDTSVCKEVGSFTVVGSLPAVGQSVAWYFIAGQGDVLTPNHTTSVVQQMTSGNNLLVYRLSHPVCGFTYDTLKISQSNCEGTEFTIPTIITPNLDGKNDLFVIDNLHNLYPECDVVIVNRWGTVLYESVGYENPWDGRFKGEDLPMGTYFYRINLNDDDKTHFSGPISIIR